MINIDYIMNLLDWNQSEENQALGRSLAKDIKCINVFLQPFDKDCGKNVWNNCAIILAEKTDEELSPILIQLLEWVQDLNWPGAFCILERLRKYADDYHFHYSYNICLKCAQALEDDTWINNLKMIKE